MKCPVEWMTAIKKFRKNRKQFYEETNNSHKRNCFNDRSCSTGDGTGRRARLGRGGTSFDWSRCRRRSCNSTAPSASVRVHISGTNGGQHSSGGLCPNSRRDSGAVRARCRCSSSGLLPSPTGLCRASGDCRSTCCGGATSCLWTSALLLSRISALVIRRRRNSINRSVQFRMKNARRLSGVFVSPIMRCGATPIV